MYIDNILVCSRTFEEHLQHLRLVNEHLREAQLRLKVSKCVFLMEQAQYLGQARDWFRYR